MNGNSNLLQPTRWAKSPFGQFPYRLAPVLLSVLAVVLFALNILYGSVHIDAGRVWQALAGALPDHDPAGYIIMGSRLPSALTALLAGAALAASGLMLQTSFRNPLAGPSVLGISSGANLGVAIVMLACGGTFSAGAFSAGGYLAVVGAAFAGSLLVMALLIFFSSLLRDNLLLLITGIMMGYITSSAISLLNFAASADNVQGFLIWGMGNFNSVPMSQMPVFAPLCLVGLTLAVLLVKPLNAMLLGEQYAVNLGVNVQRTRHFLLLATGLLTAVVTAYCGPVAFLGLATPHIAFLLLGTSNHRALMPVTMLTGASLALLCNLLCTLPAVTVIPLNAVTPLLGAPVILYVIIKARQ